MNWFSTFRKFIAETIPNTNSSEINADAVVLSSSLTGKEMAEGHEVKVLIHVSPQNKRSYLLEHCGVYKESEFKKFLQPGQQLKLSHEGKKGKIILKWSQV